jgi:hypothetical protein
VKTVNAEEQSILESCERSAMLRRHYGPILQSEPSMTFAQNGSVTVRGGDQEFRLTADEAGRICGTKGPVTPVGNARSGMCNCGVDTPHYHDGDHVITGAWPWQVRGSDV